MLIFQHSWIYKTQSFENVRITMQLKKPSRRRPPYPKFWKSFLEFERQLLSLDCLLNSRSSPIFTCILPFLNSNSANFLIIAYINIKSMSTMLIILTFEPQKKPFTLVEMVSRVGETKI